MFSDFCKTSQQHLPVILWETLWRDFIEGRERLSTPESYSVIMASPGACVLQSILELESESYNILMWFHRSPEFGTLESFHKGCGRVLSLLSWFGVGILHQEPRSFCGLKSYGQQGHLLFRLSQRFILFATP